MSLFTFSSLPELSKKRAIEIIKTEHSFFGGEELTDGAAIELLMATNDFYFYNQFGDYMGSKLFVNPVGRVS